MKYGDYSNITKDVKTLHNVHDRQGASLLIDVLAEKVGELVARHKLSEKESQRLRESLLNELREAINERV